MTSKRRLIDVDAMPITSHRRQTDVFTTSCACWERAGKNGVQRELVQIAQLAETQGDLLLLCCCFTSTAHI